MSKALQISIQSDQISPGSANYTLPSFPPSPDFPITVDGLGAPLNRVKDTKWNFVHMCNRSISLNFKSHTNGKMTKNIISNIEIFQHLITYLMYGTKSITVSTVFYYFNKLNEVFRVAAKYDTPILEMHRFPKLIDEIGRKLKQGGACHILLYLNAHKEHLGFEFLDTQSITRIFELAATKENTQTPYIPERIWRYQITRLQHAIKEFNTNKKNIKQLFSYYLDIYRKNGILDEAFLKESGYISPLKYFHPNGSFHANAKSFGVDEVIANWTLSLGSDPITNLNINSLSKYLGIISRVALILIGNYTGMRKGELSTLTSICFIHEYDEIYGDLYFIEGRTTKTIQDDNARWAVPPEAKYAVEALTSIAKLRLDCAILNPLVNTENIKEEEFPLLLRSYEPWGGLKNNEKKLAIDTEIILGYGLLIKHCPQLFDKAAITITDEDLKQARQVTPSLPPEYHVGAAWPFAMHQLRRTLIVNASYSGLVSGFSMQFQMKHLFMAMTKHYAQNFTGKGIEREFQIEFNQALAEGFSKALAEIRSKQYFSPYGDDHKILMTEFLTEKDTKALMKMIQSNGIPVRETLLGLCMSRFPCEFGGFDSITNCSSCHEAAFNKKKEPALKRLINRLMDDLRNAPQDHPIHESLTKQLKVAKEIHHVMLA